MNKEQLFWAIGDVDEELLARAERNPRNRLRWFGAAACIISFLVIGSQILLPDQSQKTSETRLARNEPASLASISSTAPAILADESQTVTEESSADRAYTDTDSLLTYPDSEKERLEMAFIRLNNRNAEYELVSSIPSNQLKEYIGEELSDNRGWYLLSGHEEHQYLIRHKKKNSYSLWEFNSFEDKSYPYKEVLEEIYGIQSAEDITKILVMPADMDNTDAGIALQKKIGTIIIDNPEDLTTIYNALSSLTCLGTGQWEHIGLLDDSPHSMLNAVRKSRYLTIVTDQGNRHINRIKYTGISHMFYEYRGIAYKALKKKEAGEIEKIMKIE